MSQTVANTLVDVFETVGVKHIFGLIGDSLNPLAAWRPLAAEVNASYDVEEEVDLSALEP